MLAGGQEEGEGGGGGGWGLKLETPDYIQRWATLLSPASALLGTPEEINKSRNFRYVF